MKTLYRRSIALHREGDLEPSRLGLLKTLELDPNNVAAKKELADVVKSIKEKKSKEKTAYTSMSVHIQDREKERQQKVQKEEEARLKDQDEWTKSKLKRRGIMFSLVASINAHNVN